MEFYELLYSEQSVKLLLESKYQIPDIIIGLNPGFTLYDKYLFPVINYIKKYKILSIFTEWTLQDMFMYFEFGFYFQINCIPNPFPSPMIQPFSKNRTMMIKNSHFCGLNVTKN